MNTCGSFLLGFQISISVIFAYLWIEGHFIIVPRAPSHPSLFKGRTLTPRGTKAFWHEFGAGVDEHNLSRHAKPLMWLCDFLKTEMCATFILIEVISNTSDDVTGHIAIWVSDLREGGEGENSTFSINPQDLSCVECGLVQKNAGAF